MSKEYFFWIGHCVFIILEVKFEKAGFGVGSFINGIATFSVLGFDCIRTNKFRLGVLGEVFNFTSSAFFLLNFSCFLTFFPLKAAWIFATTSLSIVFKSIGSSFLGFSFIGSAFITAFSSTLVSFNIFLVLFPLIIACIFMIALISFSSIFSSDFLLETSSFFFWVSDFSFGSLSDFTFDFSSFLLVFPWFSIISASFSLGASLDWLFFNGI
mmetsp:Transcript_18345/g.18320  ORF Transcript_18345/g.18320 Transcript_18345/m.18320 type:complete len:212 (-) Transcript_18345:31-666(-)